VAHVLAAGAWVGMLLCLAAVAIPLALRRVTAELPVALPAMLRAFSPVALGSAAVLAVTGTYASWVHVRSLAALRDTRYGHALLLKLVLVVVMLLLGAANWRRRGPAASAAGGAVQLARSAWAEFLVALAILLVTAVLVARPSPVDLGM
jgi:copper transport protein